MSLPELISRIRQSDATGAMIVSTYKGNPGTISILDAQGVEQYELVVESALLRREMQIDSRIRIKDLASICVKEGAQSSTIALVKYLASLMNVQFKVISDESELSALESGISTMLFSESDRKIHWTTYHSQDLVEIGPKIRIVDIRKVSNEL